MTSDDELSSINSFYYQMNVTLDTKSKNMFYLILSYLAKDDIKLRVKF